LPLRPPPPLPTRPLPPPLPVERPVLQPVGAGLPEEPEEPAEPAEPAPAPPPEPEPEPIDPVVEAAQSAPQSRRGLPTRRALYRRLKRTRRLLRLWRRVGKYLSDPERALGRGEANDLRRLLGKIEKELEEFPPPLGEAGQPGYMVVALTQMDSPRTIQTLSSSQRQSLERDWQAGQRFLVAHRDFLLGQLHALRKLSRYARLLHAVRVSLHERSTAAALLLLLALLALGVAIFRTSR
jgi:hypothetical protein